MNHTPEDQAAEPAGAADAAAPEPEAPADPAGTLEAILMVVDQPAPESDLAAAVGLPVEEVGRLLAGLAADYRGADGGTRRGFELREVGGGWRVYSAPEHAAAVERFVRDGQTARLTQAALETLAIVAYRQPVSRGRLSAIRGVNVESVVRTLLARGLIDEAGQDPESGAILYGTTPHFLERMGMASLDQLEALAPHLPGDEALAEIQEQIER
jgi:segregation and condensation protein B